MKKASWYFRIFYVGLTLIVTNSCTKEYNCEGFNLSHPLLDISVSKDLSEKLIFINESGDKIEWGKQSSHVSGEGVTHCVPGHTDCDCVTMISVLYGDNDSEYYCGFRIIDDKAIDNSYHNVSYRFYTRFIKNEYKDIEYDDINSFIDSLTIDSIEYLGQKYSDIIEFSDSIDAFSDINRVWIKPGVGLYKFWKNDECWTLKQ